MKIAIIGSRNYKDIERVRRYVDTLPDDTIVVSGGARGVDTEAVLRATDCLLETIVIEAQWERYASQKRNPAGVIRNGEMIKQVDMVVAFWDGKSSGTKNTIERARRAGLPCVINPTEFEFPLVQKGMF